MKIIPTNSSMVAGLAYDFAQQSLYAQFKNNTVYEYFGVTPEEVVQVLFDPDSVGSAFNRIIKDGPHPYLKVEDPERLNLRA